MYKKGRVNSNSRIISTDEDPSLRIESSAIINLRGVSTKLSKYKPTVYSCPLKIGNHRLTKVTVDKNKILNVKSYPLRRVLLEDKSDRCGLIESLYISRYKY